MLEHTHWVWTQEPHRWSFPAGTEVPKVPQHTHGPAPSSPTLHSQEENVLAGECVACKAAAVLCVIPPPGKSKGIQEEEPRTTHTVHPGALLGQEHPNF